MVQFAWMRKYLTGRYHIEFLAPSVWVNSDGETLTRSGHWIYKWNCFWRRKDAVAYVAEERRAGSQGIPVIKDLWTRRIVVQ